MAANQFAISYDNAWLLSVVGMGPRSSGVEVTPDQVRVRMGAAFKLDVPRSSVRSVSQDLALAGQATWGVHGLAGRWLVNGSSNGLVELAIEPPATPGAGSEPCSARRR